MSADARVWFDHESDCWEGIHDGECPNPNSHSGSPYDLEEVLEGIRMCMKTRYMRWVPRILNKGLMELAGYIT